MAKVKVANAVPDSYGLCGVRYQFVRRTPEDTYEVLTEMTCSHGHRYVLSYDADTLESATWCALTPCCFMAHDTVERENRAGY